MIKGNIGDTLIISGRSGMKYIDKYGKEYYVDSEMIVSGNSFVVFSKSMKYYDDYEKENSPDNIEYREDHDNISGIGVGKITYKNRFDSDISDIERKEVIDRIAKLLQESHIKAEVK